MAFLHLCDLRPASRSALIRIPASVQKSKSTISAGRSGYQLASTGYCRATCSMKHQAGRRCGRPASYRDSRRAGDRTANRTPHRTLRVVLAKHGLAAMPATATTAMVSMTRRGTGERHRSRRVARNAATIAATATARYTAARLRWCLTRVQAPGDRGDEAHCDDGPARDTGVRTHACQTV